MQGYFSVTDHTFSLLVPYVAMGSHKKERPVLLSGGEEVSVAHMQMVAICNQLGSESQVPKKTVLLSPRIPGMLNSEPYTFQVLP